MPSSSGLHPALLAQRPSPCQGLISRRSLLAAASSGIASLLDSRAAAAPPEPRNRLVLITIGGIRRQESFSNQGIVYVPRLFNDLLPQALFYPWTVNDGVTSHFNTIASILTGVWQHVDDWGGQMPANPGLFEYLRSQRHLGPGDEWVVTSNKQLTAKISKDVNVVLSKQLLIEAVEHILMADSGRMSLNRQQLFDEMRSLLETDYERIGWGASSPSEFRDAAVRDTFLAALTNFIQGPGAPATGDELTFLIGREVLQRIAPTILMMNFSDVEVAHAGSYALHLAGIRRADSLCHRMWAFIESNPVLRGRTALVIMNEFGRDPDGSRTNGFFNHRTNTECCRMAWSMVLGPLVRRPQVVDHVVQQIDMAPSIGSWLGVTCDQARGSQLPEIAA
jgi:hypothetical protein